MPVRIIKLLIAALFFLITVIARKIRSLFGIQEPPTLVIITYHSVKVADVRRFARQMDMLLKTGKPLSLANNLADLSSGLNIAVTFDDAYQSVLENALPILQARHIPATIFVPSGCLGKNPPWITNPRHPYAAEVVMTGEQLKSLPAELITIGSHTVTHKNLNFADKGTLKREAVDSKTDLENLLHRDITLFAAPYATLDETQTGVFIEAGYQFVFLNIPTYPATRTGSFVLGRNSVEPTDWPLEFYLKISGAYQWLPLAINLKKKLKR